VFADRDFKGGIKICDPNIETEAARYSRSVNFQTWVNFFAHEGVWGNAGGNTDDYFFGKDGDIGSGSGFHTAYLFDPFTVRPASRATLRKDFGF
jgi:hypothetical protein